MQYKIYENMHNTKISAIRYRLVGVYDLASRSEEVYVTKPKAKSAENYYDINFLTCWFPVVVPEIKDFLPDQEPPPFVFEDGGGGDGLRCQQFV